MSLLLGLGVVALAVFGGYLLEHGKPALLLQPGEFLIIWGAAAGSLVISTPRPVISRIARGISSLRSGQRYDRDLYLETLRLFYELFSLARKQGLMGIERDVERPNESDLFLRHEDFCEEPEAVRFVCDTLRLAITGGISAHDLEAMLEADLEVQEEHHLQPVHALSTIADALPGLGIVAAVLGIIIAMTSLGGPPEELGQKVAAALVGTFLGVLSSYGCVSPLAGALASRWEEKAAYFRAMRGGLIAFVKGHPPLMAIEFMRRQIPNHVRPTFAEMEALCKK